MKVALPSSLALWEAESAQAWVALCPWSDGIQRIIPFNPTIRTILEKSQRGLDSTIDDQHQHLTVVTLTRMLCAVKEIQASPVGDLMREAHHLSESKKHMQESVDRFLLIKASRIKRAAEAYSRKAQIIHISHLYSAGDLMDWIRPIVRGSLEADLAKTRMAAWAIEDDVRVRSVAYHSAQTLAIVRSLPNNQPLEAFNIFHAGVALWCMSSLLEEMHHHRPAVKSDVAKKAYRLDAGASDDRETDARAIDKWIQYGIPQPISL